MTENDGMAAVELASETLAERVEKTAKTKERLRATWAGGQKRTAREQQALLFASRLHDIGGTFEFKQEHRDFGYSNIWEAFAGERHEPGSSPMKKAHNAEEYAHVYRGGCSQLNALLLEQWDDVVVFMVPSTVDGLLIHCITINPDHVVNGAGDTAYDIWERRELKRAKGQVKSAAKKLVRATSPEMALIHISQMMAPDSLAEMVRLPKGRLELTENLA